MKTTFTLSFIFLLAFQSFSQEGINYKALIKDGGGNVVASQNVDIQFVIYQGSGETTNVYQETHTTMTDVNGIAIVNIGEGSTSDVFTDIDWGSDDHYLNVQIDTGGGLTNMGTTKFMAVPYALEAENVKSAAFKSTSGLTNNLNLSDNFLVGSTQLNDDGNVDHDNRMFFNKANGAFRVGTVEGSQWNSSNIGSGSFATGYNTTASGFASLAAGNNTTATGLYATAFGHGSMASGNWSFVLGRDVTASAEHAIAFGRGSEASADNATAMGYNTIASAIGATAMGIDNVASGESATAMGQSTTASGNYSTSLGTATTANAYSSLALGRYNLGGGSATTWVENDPLFEIGNGTASNAKSNALTILKDGTIIAPSLDMGEITDPRALTTKEYVDANGSTGLEALDEGNGIGWRLIGKNPVYYGNIGSGAIDLSRSIGVNDDIYGATNTNSFATGQYTIASGVSSTATGQYTTASGHFSTAIGDHSIASNWTSMAMGYYTTASGSYSLAMGYGTVAEANSSTALGKYNIGGGNANSWVVTDPIFEIGNGTASDAKSNALTVLKNGIILAPSFDLGEITNAKALTTKEYVDANSASGLEALDEGNGIGWRLKGKNPANYGNIGLDAVDLSYSVDASSTYGATGEQSIAMGSSTKASGRQSTAMGRLTIASGAPSTAMGFISEASGNFSTVIGYGTIAESYSSTAIGRYNVGGGNPTIWVATDKLFEIGNGTSDGSRANALTVLKNGNVGIGIHNPSTKLQVAGGNVVVESPSGIGVSATSSSSTGTAIKAFNSSNSGSTYVLEATSNSPDGTGVVGIGPKTGVYGFASAANAFGYGVRGRATGANGQGVRSEAIGESGKAFYGEATGLYGKGIHAKVTSTHSSANGILAEWGGGSSYAGYFVGRVHVAGTLSKSSGSFKIDHPLDPENKYLLHSFVESPDMMNMYNGNIITDNNGNASVTLPDYFEALNIDFRYQLTVIGQFAQAIVIKKIKNNSFEIKTDKPNVEVSWQVTGIRNDAFARKNRIQVEEEKEIENKGKYLNPEAFNVEASNAIGN